jgi:hypothetical protein
MPSYEIAKDGSIIEPLKAQQSRPTGYPAQVPCTRQILAMIQSVGRGRRTVLEAVTHGLSTNTRRSQWGRRLSLSTIGLVVLWSLVELPVELAVTPERSAMVALLISKAMVVAVSVGALLRVRWAECAFLFICALSLLAIVPALSFEMTAYPLAFRCSLLECIFKALAFVTVVRQLGGDESRCRDDSAV